MIHIANPIYDSVFKYLMEDERVARTLLSALLKKEVVSVEMRRDEYANVGRRDISMFRIDFGAKVREADGRVHLVLIELQKTWLPTETLRFRQYLGAQYSNQENMLKEDLAPSRYAIPMVAVYLLGHLVGNITEPVLYVKHKAYNYEGHEVTEGMPDPFVESLTHDRQHHCADSPPPWPHQQPAGPCAECLRPDAEGKRQSPHDQPGRDALCRR